MIFFAASYDKQGLYILMIEKNRNFFIRKYYHMACGRGNGFGREMGRSIRTI